MATKEIRNSCDLLKNSYLCLLNNTSLINGAPNPIVVICWKIRIFAYWTTPSKKKINQQNRLWFAEKFVSLLIEQHLTFANIVKTISCDLLKNSYLCLLNNTILNWVVGEYRLWFAEKFVSLLIEQHRQLGEHRLMCGCDLLKNSYLCLLNNTCSWRKGHHYGVVICWKIRIFAYWTTPRLRLQVARLRCDLLKNSYLCLLNNTAISSSAFDVSVVICWKIRIFAYWTTPDKRDWNEREAVVICWKIRIFAYWTTPRDRIAKYLPELWFAEKFVSLLIEQHPRGRWLPLLGSCDLLKNSYLCLLNNTSLAG